MYYINETPNASGNYGNPKGQPFSGSVALHDGLLSDYINAKGFVIPAIENGEVVSLEVNQEELDAYNAEHPDVPDEPTPDPIGVLQEENKLLKYQVQALSDQNDFQEELIVELANVIYA